MKLNLCNAQITEIKTSPDRGVKVKLVLPEMPAEDMTKLFSCLNNDVHTVEMDVEAGETKTPSSRLLAVIFLLWKQKYMAQYPDFDNYYRLSMDKAIEAIKEKLN